MTATFRLQPGELNESFLERLKAMFEDREIELVISEPCNADDVDYPFVNPEQTKNLLEALDRVNRREGLVSVDLKDLENRQG